MTPQSETTELAVREGKQQISIRQQQPGQSSLWRSSEEGRDGGGAVARRRNSTMQSDANKSELIDFEQGGTHF